MKPLRSALSLSLLALALPFAAHAQTAPALQYVPVVTTYAGGATATTICANATDTLGDGCIATSATLNGPTTGDTDAAGNFYFPDAGNNVIRRIDAVTGVITLVAGEIGSTAMCPAADIIGDGCPALQAPFNNPRAVRIDRAGNLVIADTTNQVIRRIDRATGIVSLLLGVPTKAARDKPNNSKPLTPLTVNLDNPYNFIFDPAGNMIVLNSTGDCAIIAIAINGIVDPVNSQVYDLAGTCGASPGPAGDGNGGLATAATFTTSRGLALDAAENVFIGDYGDNQVRKVTSPGINGQVTVAALNSAIVTDVLGTGTAGSTGNGGLGTAAETASPQGLAFDNAGLLYVEQYSNGNDFIRLVDPITDLVTNYGGTGPATFTGDGGPTAAASFYTPTGIKVSLGGRMTIADQSNSRIRNSSPFPYFIGTPVGATSTAQNAVAQATAAVTPAAINLSNSEFSAGTLSGCALGTALAANAYCTIPVTFTPAGPGLRTAQLQVVDKNANFYDDNLEGVGLAPAAAFSPAPITTLSGNGIAGSSGNQGSAVSALVNAPRGGAFDSAGNFFFADSGNHVVREISMHGTISIVAGTGTAGSAGDGTAATTAQLNAPTGVTVDPAGNLYIADAGNHKIREVSANTGVISTIAGTGTSGYTGDTGQAALATLNNPSGIAIDGAGVLYVADTGNHALRAFVPGGVIVTLAGTGAAGFSGDGGVPQLAQLNAPTAVAVDLAGNIYIADTGNSVVRRIAPLTTGIINFQGVIGAFAGTQGAGANTGDGGLASSAGLLTPGGVGVDAAGNVYIAAGGQVRLVTTDGFISTIAGTGASGPYNGENGSATAAVLPSPAQNLAVDQVGNIYLSDTAGNRVVSIASSSAAKVSFPSQTIGTTSNPQSVTLYNSGNQALALSNLSVPSGFALASTSTTACSSTTTLAPGASCTLTITFAPTAVAPYSGSLTITDNALNNAASTQTIALNGVGAAHLNPTTTAVVYAPVSPVYGQTVTLTATVSGGTNTQGNVNFVINSKTTVSAPVNGSGQATYQLQGLPAGVDTIVANYAGDSVNASSSGNTSLTVVPAVLTVTGTNIFRYPTQTNPVFGYTITGFAYSDTTGSATSGTPAFSTPAVPNSAPGTYPVIISQGTLSAPNYTFVFVPATLTVVPPTFTVSVSPNSLTLPAGQVAVTTVTVTPSPGYSGTVMLSCGQVPAKVVCTFNANTLAVDGSGPVGMQLTISADNFQHISSINQRTTILLSVLPFSALWLLGWRRRKLLGTLLALIVLAVAVQGMTGCTPGTERAASSSGPVTITATDNAAKISASATLGLTIQ